MESYRASATSENSLGQSPVLSVSITKLHSSLQMRTENSLSGHLRSVHSDRGFFKTQPDGRAHLAPSNPSQTSTQVPSSSRNCHARDASGGLQFPGACTHEHSKRVRQRRAYVPNFSSLDTAAPPPSGHAAATVDSNFIHRESILCSNKL